MEHQKIDASKIDSSARLWVVVRGPDGRLHDELDPSLMKGLSEAHSAEDIAEALVKAAGEIEIGETRLW
jgi:hypothetical protein